MQRGRAAAGMEAAFPVQAAQCENLMCDNFAHAECTPDYAVFNCPLSSSPHAHSFVLGTAVINNNNKDVIEAAAVRYFEIKYIHFILLCQGR